MVHHGLSEDWDYLTCWLLHVAWSAPWGAAVILYRMPWEERVGTWGGPGGCQSWFTQHGLHPSHQGESRDGVIMNVFCRRYIHETASQACCFAAREGTRELIISEKLPTVKQSAYLTHDVLSIQSTSRNFLVGGLLIIGPLLENSFRLKGSFFNSSNHFWYNSNDQSCDLKNVFFGD